MTTATARGAIPSGRLPAPTAVRLPPGFDGTTTRGRIIEAALSLFAHRGYHGTSIRDIAEAAGVNSATLYFHFSSKDAVLEELAVAGHQVWEDTVMAAVTAAGPAPVDRLAAFVRAHVRHHIDYAMLAVVANNELHSLAPATGAAVMTIRDRAEDVIHQIIVDGEANGSFTPLDPAATMKAIGSMGLRVANWYPNRVDAGPDELAETYATLALRMVGAAL